MTIARGDAVLYNHEEATVVATVVYAAGPHRDIRIEWYDGEKKRTRVVWAKSLKKINPVAARLREIAGLQPPGVRTVGEVRA